MKKLKVGDVWYDIIITEDMPLNSKEGEVMGECDGTKKTIKIWKNAPSFRGVLVHEVNHAIDEFMSANLTEDQVDQLANGWSMVILDNPWFLEMVEDNNEDNSSDI